MERITESNLEALVARINDATGSPSEPYTKQPDGRYLAQIGNYHLDIAYGGYALDRMVNEGGGVSVIIGRGTKRELWDKMHAFLRGFETAREGRPQAGGGAP